jgi:predicted amidohydrolase
MGKVKIGLVQFEIALGQPEENIRRLRSHLREAKLDMGLALLPELWSTGYDLQRVAELACEKDGVIFDEMSVLAREFRLFLCGSVLEAAQGRYFNTQVLCAPNGSIITSYRKIHLFGLMDEPKFLAPGAAPVTCSLPWGKLGLSICYDLRFPELFRTYALEGCQLILMSAEWPHPRLSHWRTLLVARAIENQSFVAACNTVGAGNGNVFCGHSMIVNPWGEVLVEADESEGVFCAEIDLHVADDIRSRYPFLADVQTLLPPQPVS